jgi:exonuclease SbcD
MEDLITRGYDYWALGHIHKGAFLSRDPWVVYSGNLQGRHAKETGPKGCILVEVEDGRVVAADLVPLDVVRWHQAEIDLQGKTREPELIEGIRASLTHAYRDADGHPSAVRLVLTGRTLLHDAIERRPDRLRQTVLELAGEIAGDDLWIEKIRDNTIAPTARADAAPNEAANELIRIMQEVASDAERVGPLLEKELEPLRSKLPEELKELPALKLLDKAGLARDAFSRLEPRLAARLAGEEDV